jgi:hypothetical protein
MKKILLLIAVICLVGCAGTVSKGGNEVSKNETVVEYADEYVSSGGFINESGHVCDVRHFTYKGHSYIQFDINASYGGHSGIVHDPECLKQDYRDF